MSTFVDEKILEVEGKEEVVTIGTLFKDMKLKPSIMDEYSKDRGLKLNSEAVDFCSDGDYLILEDDGGRMKITGQCLPALELVTGIVLAVRGTAEPGGDFVVTDYCLPGLPPQPSLPDPSPTEADNSPLVMLVSGLGFGKEQADQLPLQLLGEFLGGLGGDLKLSSRIARLVVAGGACPNPSSISKEKEKDSSSGPLKEMDAFISELSMALPVDLMPGPEDLTNVALPQQPLHRCLFPCASASSLFRVTNPHLFSVGGVNFLGTSGQNVNDLSKYSRHSDRLAMMELCLNSQHLTPTAPDTLTCYPYDKKDPFVIKASPHVFFAGNQSEFKSRRMIGESGQVVQVVSIPSFDKTSTAVLVNLKTLDCSSMSFNL